MSSAVLVQAPFHLWKCLKDIKHTLQIELKLIVAFEILPPNLKKSWVIFKKYNIAQFYCC